MAIHKKKKLKFQKGLKKLSPHQIAIVVIAIVGLVGIITSLFGAPTSKSYSDESVTGNFYLENSMIGYFSASGEYTETLPKTGSKLAKSTIIFGPVTAVGRNQLSGKMDVRVEWTRGGDTFTKGWGYCSKWCGVRVSFGGTFGEIPINGKIGGINYVDANYYSCISGKTCASHFRINAGDTFSAQTNPDTIKYAGAIAIGSYYKNKRYLDSIKVTFYPVGTLGKDVSVIG